MEESKVLYKVNLSSSKHKRTGTTTHSRDGQLIEELPFYLQIESNPWVKNEFYLIHYDADDNELGDTLHDGVEDAMEQANFEYNVQQSDWHKQD